MANILTRFTDWWSGNTTAPSNLYNAMAYQWLGGQSAQYDYNSKTYLEKGYGYNPDVFAMITQMADKTKAVPYYVKEIEDKQARKQLESLRIATKGDMSIQQMARAKVLESKAFKEKERDFPLERPNPLQTWGEIFALYKVYMKVTGNCYFYIVSPENGARAGEPKLLYILPAHLMKIILKKNADVLEDENPIGKYMLIEGQQFLEFETQDVIHVKYPNPFFNFDGSHLYGLSPIKALLRTIESSNDFIDHNVNTGKNGGIYGFLHSADKDKPWTPEQALQAKERLVEMDNSNGRMSKIAGSSGAIAFTKISLNTDELKPFEFLKYDQKTIANVLGWSDSLLNNDDGGKYDKQKEERKRVITDNIEPDLQLLAEALNDNFIPRFKGYENCEIQWDVTELSEMQEDYAKMLEWMSKAPLTPNEIRTALKYETIEDDGMNTVWVDSGKKRIDEVGMTDEEIEKAFRLD